MARFQTTEYNTCSGESYRERVLGIDASTPRTRLVNQGRLMVNKPFGTKPKGAIFVPIKAMQICSWATVVG